MIRLFPGCRGEDIRTQLLRGNDLKDNVLLTFLHYFRKWPPHYCEQIHCGPSGISVEVSRRALKKKNRMFRETVASITYFKPKARKLLCENDDTKYLFVQSRAPFSIWFSQFSE